MKVDTLVKYSAETAGSITVGRGHLNSILISASHKDVEMTIRYRHSKGTTVIMQNFGFQDLFSISDFYYGASNDNLDGLVTSIKAINQGLGAPIDIDSTNLKYLNWFPAQHLGRAVKLDVGSLYLSGGDELVISWTAGTAVDMQISSCSENTLPARVKTYEVTYDLNQSHNMVQDIFGRVTFDPSNPVYPKDREINFKVSDDENTYLANYYTLFGATALMGKLEIQSAANNMVLVYSNTDVLPKTVDVHVTGGDVGLLTMYVVREMVLVDTVSQNTVAEAKKQVERIAKLEKEEPELAKAYRHAGEIPKASELASAVKAVETTD